MSVYVCVHLKTISLKFRILNPNNSRSEACKFFKNRLIFDDDDDNDDDDNDDDDDDDEKKLKGALI